VPGPCPEGPPSSAAAQPARPPAPVPGPPGSPWITPGRYVDHARGKRLQPDVRGRGACQPGFIFLLTQYFQFVRDYSPLSAGVHLLPVAACVATGSTLGTRLAVRVSTKAIVTAGLVLQAAFYFWAASDLSPTLSYGIIAVQTVVYGLGMGLTSAPATESIMGAVAASQAGVGSAINDSARLLGGTLGVAVTGSVYATLYGSRLGSALPPALPARLADVAHQSIGGAYAVSAQLAGQGQGALASAVRQAATGAFDHGVSVGCVVAGLVAAGGALLAAAFLPAQPPRQLGPDRQSAELAATARDR
jgi:hypothetical protein